jgi:hypothetical protein
MGAVLSLSTFSGRFTHGLSNKVLPLPGFIRRIVVWWLNSLGEGRCGRNLVEHLHSVLLLPVSRILRISSGDLLFPFL